MYGTLRDLDTNTITEHEPEIASPSEHPLGAKGFVYYLGTKHLTAPFANPVTQGVMDSFDSGMVGNSLPSKAALGREVLRCVTKPKIGAFMGFDFKEYSVAPAFYALRHYISWDVSRHTFKL